MKRPCPKCGKIYETFKMIRHGDCLQILKELPDNFIDSLVTDPPAGISFMGKEWDKSLGFKPFMRDAFKECLRVMKPGAHGLVWAIPRTSHWTATALEDAGFEIRDVVTHLFGSGFTKSLDVSKAIDKAAGAEREIAGAHTYANRGTAQSKQSVNMSGSHEREKFLTDPSTPEAKQWQGWGTALKPASEHWILVRKPCSERIVAANVLKWGCGGLNIDASRIIAGPDHAKNGNRKGVESHWRLNGSPKKDIEASPLGRFPANLILSHNEDCVDEHEVEDSVYPTQCTPGCAVAMLDEQGYQTSGGASRFFYCAKASKRERNEGCEGLPEKEKKTLNDYVNPSEGRTASKSGAPMSNHHPTVKPIKLMQYLITMVTPPGGTILDPFMGSGSTCVAAKNSGFMFIGIEKEKEYVEIAEKRIEHAK